MDDKGVVAITVNYNNKHQTLRAKPPFKKIEHFTITLTAPRRGSKGLSVVALDTDGLKSLVKSINVDVNVGSRPSAIAASTSGQNNNTTIHQNTSIPQQLSISIASTQLHALEQTTGKVRLTKPAGQGGLHVNLSTASLYVTVSPTSLVIPQGGVSANFIAKAGPRSGQSAINVNALIEGIAKNKSITLSVLPTDVAVENISISPGIVHMGTDAVLTINLDKPASSPLVIDLVSSDPGKVSIAPQLQVQAGQKRVTAIVHVASNADGDVTISASVAGGMVKTDTLSVRNLVIESLTLNPDNPVGGQIVSARLILNHGVTVPGGIDISLSSSKPWLHLPASVHISMYSVFRDFEIQTVAQPVDYNAVITATIPSMYGGGAMQKPVAVDAMKVISVSLPNPLDLRTITKSFIRGTFELSRPAPPGGTKVAINHNFQGIINFPTEEVVNAGQTTGSFQGNILKRRGVDGDHYINITPEGGAPGGHLALAVQSFLPIPEVQSVSLDQSSTTGGDIQGTVTLSGPVSTSNYIVVLSLTKGPPYTAGFLPRVVFHPSSTIIIPEGQSSAIFNMTLTPIDHDMPLKVSARRSGAGPTVHAAEALMNMVMGLN